GLEAAALADPSGAVGERREPQQDGRERGDQGEDCQGPGQDGPGECEQGQGEQAQRENDPVRESWTVAVLPPGQIRGEGACKAPQGPQHRLCGEGPSREEHDEQCEGAEVPAQLELGGHGGEDESPGGQAAGDPAATSRRGEQITASPEPEPQKREEGCGTCDGRAAGRQDHYEREKGQERGERLTERQRADDRRGTERVQRALRHPQRSCSAVTSPCCRSRRPTGSA